MIYVSGRIYIPKMEHYRSQFAQAKHYLETGVDVYQDKKVITWFEILEQIQKQKDLSDFTMSEEVDLRIQLVSKCDRLYLLQGWEPDDMCRLEHTYAKAKGKRVIYSQKY